MRKYFQSSMAILAVTAQLSAWQQVKPDLLKKPPSLTDEAKEILKNRQMLENLELLQNFDKIRYFEYFAGGKRLEQKKDEARANPAIPNSERKAK